ncbi:DUF3048 domain-containing protein [Kitasatospora sp. NBC_01250]|uniref:DUF3048 domain-containing protein n=1 Tax=unclassified Kitasatospora TaxID=2633591 RepID=UPI002E0E5953|nr:MULTISPECIES: DUF3048 domain-containing protein [unclassified Kitasatospora]WSJ65566.1 DUF3048 domain-containing protein [Kitasatospora sp. NBC_01302]
MGLRQWWERRSTAGKVAVVSVPLVAIGVGTALATISGGGGHPTAVSSPTASGPPSGAPTAPPSGSPNGVAPLTGLDQPEGRIVAVKIDNIVNARPQTGINSADVVYTIEVEGGITRFLAVFDANHFPSVVGPVRSARESDLPILEQYGKVAFAYSGALTRFLPVLADANIFNASATQAGSSYFRGPGVAPYNLFVRPSSILAAYPDSAQAQDIGFRFGPAPAGGQAESTVNVGFPAAKFSFDWSQQEQKWLVSMDGKPARTTDAGQMGAPTVVIQHVAETTSPRGFEDSPGVPSPYAPTVGSGSATVLRDGKAYDASWSRPTDASPTTFTQPDGQPMDFHPGQVWVVLAPS